MVLHKRLSFVFVRSSEMFLCGILYVLRGTSFGGSRWCRGGRARFYFLKGIGCASVFRRGRLPFEGFGHCHFSEFSLFLYINCNRLIYVLPRIRNLIESAWPICVLLFRLNLEFVIFFLFIFPTNSILLMFNFFIAYFYFAHHKDFFCHASFL